MASDGWLPRVLVVEDSETRRAWLVDWLEERGYTVAQAENGRAALELLEGSAADRRLELVITDFHMPEMDGLSLLNALRDHEELSEIPVILYTTSLWDAPSHVVGAREKALDRLRNAVDFDAIPEVLASKVEALRILRSAPEAPAGPAATEPESAAPITAHSRSSDEAKVSEELRHLRELLEAHPEDLSVKEWVAFRLYVNELYAEAIDLYQELIDVEHRVGVQNYYLGNALHKAGRVQDALECWEITTLLHAGREIGQQAQERIDKVEAGAGAPLTTPPRREEDSGKVDRAHVLVIDDNRLLLGTLEDGLGEAGFTVATASSMAEGREVLKRALPAVILLDVNLPDFDGGRACSILKSHPSTRDIPILLISGCSEESLRARCEEAKADGYLLKPFTVHSLISYLGRFM